MGGQTVCFSATSSVRPFRVNSYIYKCQCLLCAIRRKNPGPGDSVVAKMEVCAYHTRKNIFQEACLAIKEW